MDSRSSPWNPDPPAVAAHSRYDAGGPARRSRVLLGGLTGPMLCGTRVHRALRPSPRRPRRVTRPSPGGKNLGVPTILTEPNGGLVRFRALGGIELKRTDGVDVDRILRQPKRLALLAYLTLASPRGFHRRDVLLALLWPELDQAAARHALR